MRSLKVQMAAALLVRVGAGTQIGGEALVIKKSTGAKDFEEACLTVRPAKVRGNPLPKAPKVLGPKLGRR